MSCRDTRTRLHRWLDGRLEREELLETEAHLDSCPSCKAEAEALRGVGDAIRSLVAPPVPGGIASSILAGLDRGVRHEPSTWRVLLGGSWPARVGALAAAVIVVLAGAGAGAGLAGISQTQEAATSVQLQGTGTEALGNGEGVVAMAAESLVPEDVFELAPADSGVALLLEDEWTEGNP